MSDVLSQNEPQPLKALVPRLSVGEEATHERKGLKFWLIFFSLSLAAFLSALELSAVATALPVIANDLQGSNFVWVGSAYSLASTAFLPLSGGLAEIFGRRGTLLSALVVFALGSALCGSARSMGWLIAARTVQGLGGGGILSLTSIVVSDLVPLRERGAYNGLIGLAWAVTVAIGPIIGGALAAQGSWRWIFYMNLPLSGVAITLVFLFLRLPTPSGTFMKKFRSLDWIGNIIIIGSTTAVILGLTWGGVQYAWSSTHVVVPLVLGISGTILFFFYEAKYASNPMIPFALLSNQTSFSGYIQTFINPLVALAITYYLPVYFQACRDANTVGSAVHMLGVSLCMAPTIVVAGISVTICKVYRVQLWIGWALFMLGMGIYTTIHEDTSSAEAIGIPALFGVGSGMIYATTYFPVLSPLPVTENAHALAFFAFCRSFAGVWGISIGAAILQNELGRRIPPSTLESITGVQGGGGVELAYAIIPQISNLPPNIKTIVRRAFADSLVVLWKVMVGILGIGLLSSLFMKNVPLQQQLDERWRMEETYEE